MHWIRFIVKMVLQIIWHPRKFGIPIPNFLRKYGIPLGNQASPILSETVHNVTLGDWHPNISEKLHHAKFPKRVTYLHVRVAKSIFGMGGTKTWGGHISGTFIVIRTIPGKATSIH